MKLLVIVALFITCLMGQVLHSEGADASTFDVLYRFPSLSSGSFPDMIVFGKDDTIYGVTAGGGDLKNCQYGCGTVFSLAKARNGYLERVIYAWPLRAADPNSLIIDSSGTLYGTTGLGVVNENGSVFKLTPRAGGGYRQSTILQFTGSNGSTPSSVVETPDGSLLGTVSTSMNGNTLGGIFKLTPLKERYLESYAYQFADTSEGEKPTTLTIGPDGAFYGSTELGGDLSCTGAGCGVIFRLAPTAGGYSEKLLFEFNAVDGIGPTSPLNVDSKGNIYGTARGGHCFGINCGESTGVAFQLTKSGDSYSEVVLHTFRKTHDGQYPSSTLVPYHGRFYGTTATGTGPFKSGIIFELTPERGGGMRETIVHSFGTMDGVQPQGLIAGPDDALYGVTNYGGIGNNGTVFRFKP